MNPVMHSLYSLQKANLEYSYPCDIIDTGQGCKPMNLGCSITRPGFCSLKLEGIKAREINAKSP